MPTTGFTARDGSTESIVLIFALFYAANILTDLAVSKSPEP